MIRNDLFRYGIERVGVYYFQKKTSVCRLNYKNDGVLKSSFAKGDGELFQRTIRNIDLHRVAFIRS